jgi:hypothetical protein
MILRRAVAVSFASTLIHSITLGKVPSFRAIIKKAAISDSGIKDKP